MEGAYLYGNGSTEPGTGSLRISEVVACYSSWLWRGLLAGEEFAGWAPSDKLLGETNGKQPAERCGDLCKSLAPRVVLARSLWGAGARDSGTGDLGMNCGVGTPGETGCLQQQQDITLHTSQPSPSRPHWPLSTLTKPNCTWVIFRPLKNGSAEEPECVLGRTPKHYSIKACRVWVRDGSRVPTPLLRSTCSIWIASR